MTYNRRHLKYKYKTFNYKYETLRERHYKDVEVNFYLNHLMICKEDFRLSVFSHGIIYVEALYL